MSNYDQELYLKQRISELQSDLAAAQKRVAELEVSLREAQQAGTPYSIERDRMNALILRVAELEGELIEARDPTNRVVPYWMLHGLLSIVINRDCEIDDDGCENTGDCITEWCIPCAARAFWSELHKSKPAPTPGEDGE